MYDLYKNNFEYKTKQDLNSFIKDILAISEQYIGYLCYTGKIYLPDDINPYDASIDVTAELFKTKDNSLTIFKNYFELLENKPKNKEEFEKQIKCYIYAAIQNNLINLFKQHDPVTYKVIRNLKGAIESGRYNTVSLFTDKYIYIGEIDFNKGEYIERDTLLNYLYSNNISNKISISGLLKKVFSFLESREEYIKTISIGDMVCIYKDILSSQYRSEIPQNDYEEKLHYKFLMEGLKNRFYLKIKKYFLKKKISEKEQECIYNIINEVINSYLNGIKHDSVKNLVDRHFDGIKKNNHYNKIEYLINLINKDILIESGYLKNE